MNEKEKEVRFWPEDFYLKERIIVSSADCKNGGVFISIRESGIELSYYEALDLAKWLAVHVNKPIVGKPLYCVKCDKYHALNYDCVAVQ